MILSRPRTCSSTGGLLAPIEVAKTGAPDDGRVGAQEGTISSDHRPVSGPAAGQRGGPSEIHPSANTELRRLESDSLPRTHVLLGMLHLFVETFDCQPLALLDPRTLCQTPLNYGREVLFSVLALTSSFSHRASIFQSEIESARSYYERSRRLVAEKVCGGRVGLSTIQAVCLLAYADLLCECRRPKRLN